MSLGIDNIIFNYIYQWLRIFGDNRNFNLDEIVKEITYFKGTSYYINEFCMTGQYNCPKNNFSELAIFVSGG